MRRNEISPEEIPNTKGKPCGNSECPEIFRQPYTKIVLPILRLRIQEYGLHQFRGKNANLAF